MATFGNLAGLLTKTINQNAGSIANTIGNVVNNVKKAQTVSLIKQKYQPGQTLSPQDAAALKQSAAPITPPVAKQPALLPTTLSAPTGKEKTFSQLSTGQQFQAGAKEPDFGMKTKVLAAATGQAISRTGTELEKRVGKIIEGEAQDSWKRRFFETGRDIVSPVLHGVGGGITELTGGENLQAKPQVVKGLTSLVFGGLQATPAGAVFNGIINQPEIKPITDKAFGLLDSAKTTIRSLPVIKDLPPEAQAAVDVGVDLLAFSLLHKAVKAPFKTTKTIEAPHPITGEMVKIKIPVDTEGWSGFKKDLVEQIQALKEDPIEYLKTQQIGLSIKDVSKEQPVRKEVFNSEAGANVYQELAGALPGKRFAVEGGTVGQKSSFPDWIPEHLRKTPLLQKVQEHLLNDTYPKFKNQIDLYNIVRDRMESEFARVTSEIPKEIAPIYDIAKKSESVEEFSKWLNEKSQTGTPEEIKMLTDAANSGKSVADIYHESKTTDLTPEQAARRAQFEAEADIGLTREHIKTLPEEKPIETRLSQERLPEAPDFSVERNIERLKSEEAPLDKIQAEVIGAAEKLKLDQTSDGRIPPGTEKSIEGLGRSVNKKVNILDWFRTPHNVLKKIGLEKEGDLLRKQYNKYLDELPIEINKITGWYDAVKSEANSSQNIFKYLDGQKVELTPTELRVAGEIRAYLDDWATKLGLPEDKRIAHYITHIFDDSFITKEFDEDLAKLIVDKVPGSVYDPFLQKRLGAQGYKEDVFAALDAYAKRAVRKYNLDPALKELSDAAESLDLDSFNYVKSLTARVNLRPTQIDNYIDNAIKQSPIGYKLGARPVARASSQTRRLVYRGALGLNVGSAFRNLTQGANTYAMLGEKYTAIGYMKTLKEAFTGGKELSEVGVLRDSFIQDRQLSAIKKTAQKMDKGLFFLFEQAEKINRGAAYFGAKAKALKQGKSEAQAVAEGVEMARKTQFTFNNVETPVALQSDIVKLFSQFQSFNVKQAEFLGGMAKSKNWAGLVRYVGANLVIANTIGNLFGYQLSDMIPFSGAAAGQTKLGETPPIKLTNTILQGLLNAPDKYGKERSIQEKVDAVLSDLKPFIPAGVQLSKSADTIMALYNGGEVTSKSGKTVKFTIPKDNLSEIVRGVLFGKYNTEAGREYIQNLKNDNEGDGLTTLSEAVKGQSKERNENIRTTMEGFIQNKDKQGLQKYIEGLDKNDASYAIKHVKDLAVQKKEAQVQLSTLDTAIQNKDKAKLKEIMNSLESDKDKQALLKYIVQAKKMAK